MPSAATPLLVTIVLLRRRCCWAPAGRLAGHAAVDRYLLPAEPTAANPLHTAAACSGQ